VNDKNELQIEFLEALLSINRIDALHTFVLDFLASKFKLSNCTIISNNVEAIKVDNSSLKLVYSAVQTVVIHQIASMRAAFVVSNIAKDFLFDGINGLENIPQNLLAIPFVKEKEVLGCIICYSTDSIKERLELLSWFCDKLVIAIQKLNNYYAIENSALTDSLTGLNNRIYFEVVANKWIPKARQENFATSLILFDIDNFKVFNDSNGHVAGDVLLKNLGAILKNISPENFSVCRYGGEEFILFLPKIKSDECFSFAELVRNKVFEVLGVTVSLGICSCLNSSVDSLSMIKEADIALYKAKNSGKNRAVQRIIVDKNLGVIDAEDAGSVGKTYSE